MTNLTPWQRHIRELQDAVPEHQDFPGADFAARDWMERAEDVLTTWELSRQDRAGDEEGFFLDVANDAAELLAVWGGLSRIQPQLLNEGLLNAVAAAVERDASSISELVAALDIPGDWLHMARECLEDSLDPDIAHEEKSRRALELFCQLDDFQLIAWGLLKLEFTLSDEMFERLGDARKWVSTHPETFVEVHRYIYSQFLSFRIDLDVNNPDLALTQTKYHHVIEALDEQHRYLRGEYGLGIEYTDQIEEDLDSWRGRNESVLNPERRDRTKVTVRDMWRKFKNTRELSSHKQPTNRYTLRPPLPEDRTLGARAAEDRGGAGIRYEWTGPTDDWLAFVRLPAPEEADPESTVTLWMVGIDDVTAVELAGIRRERGDAKDGVKFSFKELRDAWQEYDGPTLAVIFPDDKVEFGALKSDD